MTFYRPVETSLNNINIDVKVGMNFLGNSNIISVGWIYRKTIICSFFC